MREHLQDAALDAQRVGREEADHDDAHMGHRAVGDQLLHVGLHQRHERGVDDGDDGEREDEGREVGRGVGQHRQREAQEAVAAELQQHARQQHRPRRRRLDVGVRQPGVEGPHRHLDREGREHGEPEPYLQARVEIVGHQDRDVGRPCLHVHDDDGDEEEDRAQERVEEELEGGVDAPRPAPDRR